MSDRPTYRGVPLSLIQAVLVTTSARPVVAVWLLAG